MKRIYHPYWLWEDWQNGLFETDGYDEKETERLTELAKSLLENQEEFFRIAKEVITEWKYAAEMNLSNKGRNRQAWIGQASCCYKYKIPEYMTKYAWRMMSEENRIKANNTADNVIATWERNHA